MKIHEVCSIFPMMDEKSYADLVEDIKNKGLIVPIWTYQGAIIDGRNRMKACEELGIKPKFQEWDGIGSLIGFVVSLNMERRHLTSSQKATCALEIAPRLAVEAKERQRASGGDRKSPEAKAKSVVTILSQPILGTTISTPSPIATKIDQQIQARLPEPGRHKPAPKTRDEAAKLVGASPSYVQDAKAIKTASPVLFDRVKNGEINIPQAKKIVPKVIEEKKFAERTVKDIMTGPTLLPVPERERQAAEIRRKADKKIEEIVSGKPAARKKKDDNHLVIPPDPPRAKCNEASIVPKTPEQEAWLNTHRMRHQVVSHRFDEDALIYQIVQPMFKKLREAILTAVGERSESGASLLYKSIVDLVSIPGIDQWEICTKCNGSGCSKCHQGGYRIKGVSS